MYITATQLMSFFGVEITQLATPLHYKAVTEKLFTLTIEGRDRSDYTAEEIKAANETLIVVNEAAMYAGQEINSYLVKSYTLPLSELIITNNPILGFCADITRYRIAKNHPKEEISKRYDNAIKWLRDIATGRAGLIDPNSEAGSAIPLIGKTYVKQSKSHFNWEDY